MMLRPRSATPWSRRHDAGDLAALAALLGVLGLVLATGALSPQKDDIAWLLYVARKWLGGQRLYEDLIEVNPPLIIWIYAIPASLGGWLGVAPRLVATPFFAAMVLGSAWWTALLLRGRATLFDLPIPVFAAIGTVLLAMPGVEFGQREHLLFAAVLPYLVLFTRELEGEPEPRSTAIAAGIVAGLGCALKPTYALAFVLLELVGAVRGHRPLRAASIVAAATLVAYGGIVVVFCPAFLEKAVPLALALYGGTDTPCWKILSISYRLLFAEATALLVCWSSAGALARRSPFLRHLLLALTAFGVGATVVFVLQGKDWFYHRLPATEATVLALLLWCAAMLPHARVRPRLWLTAPLVLAALLEFSVADFNRLKPWVAAAIAPEQSVEVRLERLIRQEHAHTYIAFSEWIALGFPVVNNTGVTWASRFDSMWALRGELWRAGQDGTEPKEWPIRHWVARDFVAGCPDIAVVDTREGINYVAVLVASDVDFAQAWQRYREIAAFDGLRVLKHEGTAGCGAPPIAPAPQKLTRQKITWAIVPE